MRPAALPTSALHRAELDFVAERRRGAVRVDVVDVAGGNSGAFDRHGHAAERPVAVRRRRGDVIGVARQPVAGEFGINLGAARLGVVERFQHHGAGALAHHETVAVLVVRARGALGRVVEIGRQRAQRRKARQRHAIDRRFGAARHHHLGIAERHHARRIANGMRAGRAGGDHRVVGAFQAECDRDEAGSEIDDAARNKERRNPARAFLVQHDRRSRRCLRCRRCRSRSARRSRSGPRNFAAASRHRRAPAWPRTCAKRMKSSTLRCSFGSIH